MFKRKLIALDYPSACDVDANNDKQFRSIILWLEDQKIRHYKIEDRKLLREINSDDWTKAYTKYKTDIACPIKTRSQVEELQWFLSYAVRLEYADNKEKYNAQSEKKVQSNTPNVVTQNPLDNLNFNSPEFKNGVNALAKILKISQHPDHFVTLKAIRKLINTRLTPEIIANPQRVIVKGTPYPYQDDTLGFDLGDPMMNQAAKVLRLIYIQNLRQLQTSINELIVAVQNITANPKTDTKLGKVGI